MCASSGRATGRAGVVRVREAFVGREDELRRLLASWDAVRHGEGPRLEVILGESGMGKTRLVQRFYESVARGDVPDGAPQGYWPTTLDGDAVSMDVNPSMDGVDSQFPPTFLWWGMRLVNPRQRNQVHSGAVSNYLPMLTPHLAVLQRSKRTKQALGKLGKVAIKVGANFVPGLGAVVEGSENVKDVLDAGRDLLASKPSDAAAVDREARADVNESVVDILTELVRSRDGAARMPIVWLIDDAQFSPSDPGATDLVKRVLRDAITASWPLLVVVTHWQWEWNTEASQARSDGILDAIREVWNPVHPEWTPLVLGPMPPRSLEPALRAHLPGLTPDQVEKVLDKAGGQPGVLAEIVKICEARGRYFVDRDPTKPFTAKGLERVLALPSGFTNLAEERLADLPTPVAQLLSLSSVQGLRLSHRLNRKVAERLSDHLDDAEAVVDEDTLAQAMHPYSVFVRRSTSTIQFVQRVLLEAARNRLPDSLDVDEDDVIDVWREVLRDEYRSSRPDLPDDERALLDELVVDAFYDADTDDVADLVPPALLRLLHRARRRGDTRAGVGIARDLLHGIEDARWDVEDLAFPGVRALFHAFKQAHAFDDALACAQLLTDIAGTNQEAYHAANARGDVLRSKRDEQGSLAAWQEAFDIAAREVERDGAESWRRDLAWAHYRLAKDAREHGDTEAAVAGFEAAIEIFEDLAATSSMPGSENGAARCHRFLGATWKDQGDLERSLEHFEQALVINERLRVRGDAPDADVGVSISLGDVGDVHMRRGELDRALDAYQRALALSEERFERDPSPDVERGLCISLNRVGHVLTRLEREDEGIEHHERALAIGEAQYEALRTSDAEEGLTYTLSYLGAIRRDRGDFVGAAERFERSGAIWERAAQRREGTRKVRPARNALRALGEARACLRADVEQSGSTERDEAIRALDERVAALEEGIDGA